MLALDNANVDAVIGLALVKLRQRNHDEYFDKL